MIISPTDWEMLYGHKWITPNDPGSPPILAAGTLTVNTKNTIHSHQNKVNLYDLMINTEAAFKQKIMSSVDTNYLMGLSNNNTGFAGVLAWIIMDYLYTNHEKIEYEDMVANKHQLTNPFDPTQPILNLFNRYKYIITIATKGGYPISAQNKFHHPTYYLEHQEYMIERLKTGTA